MSLHYIVELNIWCKKFTDMRIVFASNGRKIYYINKNMLMKIIYPEINSCLFNFLSPPTSSFLIISCARCFGSLSPLRSVSPTRSY